MVLAFGLTIVSIEIVFLLIIYSMLGRQFNEYGRSFPLPFIFSILAIIFYTISFFITSKITAAVFRGLYFAATTWLIYFILNFTRLYTNYERHKKWSRPVFLALSSLDSVSLILNIFTNHAFGISRKSFTVFNLPYWSVEFKTGIYIHFALCTVMIAVTAFMLIMRLVKSPSLYHSKYLSFLLVYITVVTVHAACNITDFPVDISLLLHGFLVHCIFYYSTIIAPRNIVLKSLVNIHRNIDEGICCFDTKGNCIYFNKEFRRILNINERENTKPVEQFLLEFLEETASDEKGFCIADKKINVNGEEKIYEVLHQPLYFNEGIVGSSLILRDKTEEIIALKREKYKATHDLLTGIFNRETFFEKVDQAIHEAPYEHWLMLCSNIKDFKLVNELLGEEIGNMILRYQADTMRELSHEKNIYGRIVDDKFAMLIRKEDFDEELIQKNIYIMAKLTESSCYKMHLNVGIYEIRNVHEGATVMYDKAHLAIQRLPDDYQKIFEWYDDRLMNQLVEEKNILGLFDAALLTNQFKMYLQPNLDENKKLLGAEALIRWKNYYDEIVLPEKFVPVLENAGLIYKLDMFIWEEAVRQLKEWKEKGLENLYITVNVSSKDFYYIDAYTCLMNLVEKYGVNPKKLKIEIKETVLMNAFTNSMMLLERLQKSGFEILIDDFGIEYSSLNMLKDINADILKIDMCMIKQTEEGSKDYIILKHIIEMAEHLKMQVITEGVETKAQFELLKKLGCRTFQGFYFCEPVSPDELELRFL